MIPLGSSSATRVAGRSWRTIWQKTFSSRTRRAMSWAYCEPKSKIRTSSLVIAGPSGCRSPRVGPERARHGRPHLVLLVQVTQQIHSDRVRVVGRVREHGHGHPAFGHEPNKRAVAAGAA